MKYLKFITLTSAAFLLLATSCDDPKDHPAGVNPPVIAITNETPMVVNLYDSTNLPYIQGSVIAEGSLTNVSIFVARGDVHQQIDEHTTFENSRLFELNFRPEYALDMTGIRITATDAQGQTSTLDFPFEVVNFSDTTTTPPYNRLAFPTAEGGGRYTWGGRGGRVLVVNTLADNNSPGSFRWAVNQSGARTIIFDVSGTITLSSRLNITNDSLTIAGQTAPGDGITIRGHTVVNQANEVIVRFIRFRTGPGHDVDAFEGRQRRNIIIDHVSTSWATDEVASWYNNRYFTMQWSIISEPLDVGGRGMGGLMGGHTATFANNLFAHTRSRNPRINGARLSGHNQALEVAEFVNNVIFNHAGPPNGGEAGRYNIRNNFFRPGPASGNNARNRFLTAYSRNDGGRFVDFGTFYISGNTMHGNPTISGYNWSGGVTNSGASAVFLENSPNSTRRNIQSVRATTPFMPEFAINMRTAEEAFDVVLERAGASFRRDAVDTRIVNEARTGVVVHGNGLLGATLGPRDWPVLNSEDPAPRTLRGTANDDGIPDWFKNQHGLPLDQNVANRYNLSPVFTNLEMYLNYIVQHIHN